MKKHELSLEFDSKLEEMFLKFKYDEIKKNRQHELKTAKIMQMRWYITFDILHEVL